jgi:MFS family permease
MLTSLRRTYNEFPRNFWTVMVATFVDELGRFLLFPFFALYITQRFDVGMTQVGYLFAIFSLSSIVGSLLGGALTDKFGRRTMLLFGLLVSGLSSLLMAIVDDLNVFYSLAAFVGLISSAGGPAQQAMIADLLPADKRAEGYAIHRVVFNVAAAIGPALGGLLAAYSFTYLFIADATSSVITAVIVFLILPETKPQAPEDQPEQSILQTVGGYGVVLRDFAFVAFTFISIIVTLVYVQYNTTLSVFLRDVHDIPPQGYGYLITINAGMVVFLQFLVTRRVAHRPPMLMMALGTFFYAIGFGMFGFGSSFAYFVLAMVIITIGEMVISPVGTSLVASFAPEHMRGRYLAIFGFTWGISFALGPLLAGVVMDNYDPRWVWYASFILGMVAVFGYLLLRARVTDRLALEED